MRSASYYDEELAVSEKRHAVENILLPGEEVLQVATISPGIYWKGLAMLLVACFALIYSTELAFFFAIVSGIMLLTSYTTRRFLMLVATTQRIVLSGGFFTAETLNVPYSKVEGIEVFRSIPGMIFGYSAVILSGTGRMRIMIPFIANAGALMEEITGLMLDREAQRTGSHYRPSYA